MPNLLTQFARLLEDYMILRRRYRFPVRRTTPPRGCFRGYRRIESARFRRDEATRFFRSFP